MRQRLQKIISAAGLCSRRTAEEWIVAGRVQVNGTVAALGEQADPELDEILLDGKIVRVVEKKLYIMLNKPRGYVTTLQDEKGRPNVSELVADCGERVYPVGRLDIDSEGLLLLTNDGEWMQHVLHPKYEVDKTYHVTVAGKVAGAAVRLAAIREINGERIARATVKTLREGKDTALLAITIHQGKNRQIRRMCAQEGLHVKRLQRVSEHKVVLGDLPLGAWRPLSEKELRSFDEKN